MRRSLFSTVFVFCFESDSNVLLFGVCGLYACHFLVFEALLVNRRL